MKLGDITYLTMITDASHSQQTRVAGWAGKVIVEGLRRTWTGAEPEIANSNEAELIAVEKTVEQAYIGNVLRPDLGWVLQVDNTHVVGLLNHCFQHNRGTPGMIKPARMPAMTPRMERSVIRIAEILAVTPRRFLYVKHVKGHVRKTDRLARHHVHEDMDQLCKQARKEFENA